MIDCGLPALRIRGDKILVRAQANQIDAVSKGMAFELATIGASSGVERPLFLDLHLPMQNVHTFDSQLRGAIDHVLDRVFLLLEVPIGIRGDSELDPFFERWRRRSLLSDGRGGE